MRLASRNSDRFLQGNNTDSMGNVHAVGILITSIGIDSIWIV